MNTATIDYLEIARIVLDVSIVSWLLYRLLVLVRGTRAMPMLIGLVSVAAFYFIAQQLGLRTIAWILGNFLGSIILVVVVLFQDEIRRALTKVGLFRFFSGRTKGEVVTSYDEILLAAERLARDRVGALLVIERGIGLEEYAEQGVALDALVDRKLIISIFQKSSLLHDGALVIRDGRIKRAGVVLPLSVQDSRDGIASEAQGLGTRHRAALGLSERSDAAVIIVSEGNGTISLARDGKLLVDIDRSTLEQELKKMEQATNNQ